MHIFAVVLQIRLNATWHKSCREDIRILTLSLILITPAGYEKNSIYFVCNHTYGCDVTRFQINAKQFDQWKSYPS